MWRTDRDGNILTIPDHNYSDAMDAIRYAMESLRPQEDEEEDVRSGNLTKIWAQNFKDRLYLGVQAAHTTNGLKIRLLKNFITNAEGLENGVD